MVQFARYKEPTPRPRVRPNNPYYYRDLLREQTDLADKIIELHDIISFSASDDPINSDDLEKLCLKYTIVCQKIDGTYEKDNPDEILYKKIIRKDWPGKDFPGPDRQTEGF